MEKEAAFNILREVHDNSIFSVRIALETLVPELQDSEDERIRKAIILFFETQDEKTTYSFVRRNDILTWLKRQGERKTIEWTPYDEYQINTILHNLEEICKKKNKKDQTQRYQNQYNWLKTLKSKIKGGS